MATKKTTKKSKPTLLQKFMALPKPLVVALLFGGIGIGYFLAQTFAASTYVKYWGSLSPKSPTAQYQLTTGAGDMVIDFSNNTADQMVTVKNSSNATVGTLKSIGKTDVHLTISVTPGTYTFVVGPVSGTQSTGTKGYKLGITYPTADLTKPTAVIASPLTLETVKGIVDYTVDAKDDVKIAKVDTYVDGTLHASLSAAPYTAKWDTTKVASGTHVLSVKAYDTAGNIGEASGQVNVQNATREPFGMSAPKDMWDLRLSEVGGPQHIKFRRLFYRGFTSDFSLVQRAVNDGMMPIISFKVDPYTWAQVASGAADADIRAMVKRLNAIPGEKFVALHHEPAKDGTAKDWSDMQVHALPVIKSAGVNIKVGVIGNGWWWSSQSNGYSDAEIAQWVTPQVISVSDVIAADTYQDDQLKESGGPKIKNMGSWARRVGGVKALGIGEFNGLNATGITEAMNAVKQEPLVAWACVWNSQDGGTVGFPLSGDRLDAFKRGLATPDLTQ